MHRHEISFSVFEASVFYQWQAHCVPRDGMRKEKLRRGASGNCTPIPSNWIARCTIPWWLERDISTAVSAATGSSHDHPGAGERPAAAGKMQALHSRRGFDLGRLTRQTMRWMLIPPVSILETRSTRCRGSKPRAE